MGSTRMWVLLVVAQLAILVLLSAADPLTAATPALRYTGYACLAGIFACVPPILVKQFVAAQVRIGNGRHPLVQALQQYEAAVIFTVWAMIGLALFMAMPRIMSDIRAEESVADARARVALGQPPIPPAAASSTAAVPAEANAAAVTTPAPQSPERAAIVDAVRPRLRSSGSFRVDHIRMTPQWAFVRATETVKLDGGEVQETDNTIVALLELPRESTTRWWRIVDYWTLPEDAGRPLAEFKRRVRERQQTERLPAALFPADF